MFGTQTNLDKDLERRFDRIEGKLGTMTVAIISGGIAMATSVYWLAGRINIQNGRVTTVERRSYRNEGKLQIVTWVGVTLLGVLLPVISYVVIKIIESI